MVEIHYDPDLGHRMATEILEARKRLSKLNNLEKLGYYIKNSVDKGNKVEGKVCFQRGPSKTRIDYFFFGKTLSELSSDPKARDHPLEFAYKKLEKICKPYKVGHNGHNIWIPK
jgi:hypothetical protein